MDLHPGIEPESTVLVAEVLSTSLFTTCLLRRNDSGIDGTLDQRPYDPEDEEQELHPLEEAELLAKQLQAAATLKQRKKMLNILFLLQFLKLKAMPKNEEHFIIN